MREDGNRIWRIRFVSVAGSGTRLCVSLKDDLAGWLAFVNLQAILCHIAHLRCLHASHLIFTRARCARKPLHRHELTVPANATGKCLNPKKGMA